MKVNESITWSWSKMVLGRRSNCKTFLRVGMK